MNASPWSRILRRPVSAGIAGAIAILAGAALAVAPVTVSKTTVEWPAEGQSSESTVLLLTNQTPYTLDLVFDAAAVDAAGGGTVFATMDPARGDARTLGLVVEAIEGAEGADGGIVVSSGGRSEQISTAGVDRFELFSSADGVRIEADGAVLTEWPEVPQPQIDALITDAQGLDAGSLTASAQVVDDPNSVPSPAKIALMVVMWTALAFALILLRRDDRDPLTGTRAPAAPRRRARITVSDVLVVLALGAWVFIGPMTDDDGYYAHMSANYGAAGYVGNYFQMFNQPFTPFTWFWQFLWGWQEVGGSSPVWLRVPALIAAVVAWFLTRRLLDRILEGRSALLVRFGRILLAVFFVAWWSAYTIGSRPEGIGALAFIVALTLVLRSIERRTLLPAAFGALAAGLAFAAHPTGAVAFAPIVLAVPALWSIARRDGADVVSALARTIAVLSVGSVALFAAFADGTVHDALTNSARFSAVELPLGWRDEWIRYSFLLSDEPMGSYAKRAVVLIALVALLWFVILWAASHARRPELMLFPFALVGWSTALGFVALWVTTSKWTHHFGALASAGPLLIAVVVLAGPSIARGLFADRRIPLWLPIVAAASFVPAAILSLRGRNVWAYSWDQFMYGSGEPPAIAGRALASQPVWFAVLLAALVGGALLARRRRDRASALYAPAALLLVFALVSTGFLYGTFGNAALRGLTSYSPGAANLRDPAGDACLSEQAVAVWDTTAGADLEVADTNATTELSTSAGRSVFHPGDDLIGNGVMASGAENAPVEPPSGSGRTWTSSADAVGAGAAATDWYSLPTAMDPDSRVTALVGGRASGASGNGLVVQVGREDDGAVAVSRESWLTDAAERPGWRTLVTDIGPADLGDGAVVRIIGLDGSAAPGNWFGFSAPRLTEGTTMAKIAGDSPSLVSWQSTFWFPCARPITIADGIIEPPVYATTWGNDPPDNIWVDRRGGALAGVSRIANVNTPASAMPEVGGNWGRLVLFDYPFRTDNYTISKEPVTVSGLSAPFGLPSQLTDWAARG